MTQCYGYGPRFKYHYSQVSTKINDMLSKTSTSGALEAFDRMQEKVEKMEAEAEVISTLKATASFLYFLTGFIR